MRHLTPALSSRIFTPSLISLYTFLSSSPTTCLLHVASNVDINLSLERACILYRHYQTIFSKTQKASLKIRNVALNNTNVASNVAMNPGLEQACILLQEKRDKLPKTQKAPLEIRNVDLANTNVATDVALKLALERVCILLQEKRAIFPKTQKIALEIRNVDPNNTNVDINPGVERACILSPPPFPESVRERASLPDTFSGDPVRDAPRDL